jgi:hypothetical protein
MEIGYVVRDASRWLVEVEGEATEFDVQYYEHLLEKAWDEMAFTLDRIVTQAESPGPEVLVPFTPGSMTGED